MLSTVKLQQLVLAEKHFAWLYCKDFICTTKAICSNPDYSDQYYQQGEAGKVSWKGTLLKSGEG